jgi:nitrogen fixation protein FixH
MTTHLSARMLPTELASPSGVARPRRLRAARLWPWVPALLLASLIGTQITVLASALDDPTFSTEDDYYRKAVDWDAHMARQRQSQALGWTAQTRIDAFGAGDRAVSIELRDARGAVVSGARARAVAFANTRASRPLELALEEQSPGVYHAMLGAARTGLWELRLSATRGVDAYETTLRFELVAEERAR